MHGTKEFREVVDELKRQGWKVEKTERNHHQAKPPNGGQLVHFGDSDGARSFQNTIGQLRRAGFAWPPPAAPKPARTRIEETATPAPAADASPSSDDAMEHSWRELKEARTYLALEEETLATCARSLEDAQVRYDSAKKSRDAAVNLLRRCKAKFDKEFAVPSTLESDLRPGEVDARDE